MKTINELFTHLESIKTDPELLLQLKDAVRVWSNAAVAKLQAQPDERAAFVKAVQSLAFLCRTESKRLDDETLSALDSVETHLVAMGASKRDGDGELSSVTDLEGSCFAPACGKWDGNQQCTCARATTPHPVACAACDVGVCSAHREQDRGSSPHPVAGSAGQAPVAQWQTKLREPILPECDVWINVSEEGAKKAREQWPHVYEVRALFTAPSLTTDAKDKK